MLKNNQKFTRRGDVRRPYNRYSNQQTVRVSSYKKVQAEQSLTFLLALAVIAMGGLFMFRVSIHAQNSVIGSEHAVILADIVGPFKKGPKINERQMNDDIGSLIRQYSDLNIAVVYQDLTSGKVYNFGDVNKPFIGASVPKLITAALYLSEVDSGKRSLSDSVAGTTASAHIKAMIELSDNSSWLALDKTLGYSNLENYAKSIGMSQYRHSNNSLSAKDISTLLQKLYGGKLLSQSSQKTLLGHMARANYRDYIVSVLPTGFKSYHKVGFLPDRIHDVAIVDNGEYPYMLVIFTEAKSGRSYTGGAFLLREITRIINKPYLEKT